MYNTEHEIALTDATMPSHCSPHVVSCCPPCHVTLPPCHIALPAVLHHCPRCVVLRCQIEGDVAQIMAIELRRAREEADGVMVWRLQSDISEACGGLLVNRCGS